MNRKPLLFILISMCCAPAISLCAQAFNLQDKLSMKSLKLSSSEDGKGLVIEDFNLFKSNAVDQLMTASGIQAKADPESIIRSRADSFYAIFKAKKVVALPKDDMPLLRFFPGMDTESKVLANLIFTLNRLGGTKSFTYEVKKGDTLVIEYQILKGHGFDEFEVVEGKETRFTASRNPKRFQVQHELIVAADGVVTINLENKSPLRSRGRLVVTNRPAAARFSLRYVCDTLFDVAKVVVEKKDTTAESLLSQPVRLSSKRDITRTSRAQVNVSWPAGRRCIGWGYRMADLQDSLPEGLAEYVLTEVRRNGMVRLPDEGPRDMKMTIRAGTRTLLRDPEGRLFEGEGMRATANPRKYFGAFQMPSNANAIPALQLDIENTSRLYTTSASIQLVGVFVDTHSEETEIVRKICRDFIMLSYL